MSKVWVLSSANKLVGTYNKIEVFKNFPSHLTVMEFVSDGEEYITYSEVSEITRSIRCDGSGSFCFTFFEVKEQEVMDD